MTEGAPTRPQLEEPEYLAEMSLEAQRKGEADFREIEAKLATELPPQTFEQAASRLRIINDEGQIDGGGIFRFTPPVTWTKGRGGIYSFLPDPRAGKMDPNARYWAGNKHRVAGTHTSGREVFTGKYDEDGLAVSGRWSTLEGKSFTGQFSSIDGISRGSYFLGRLTLPDGSYFDGLLWGDFKMTTGILKAADGKTLETYSLEERTVINQTLVEEGSRNVAEQPLEGDLLPCLQELVGEENVTVEVSNTIGAASVRSRITALLTSRLETPLVNISPQDDDNSRAIMEKIRTENITDEATIQAIVDSYEFSSPETKQHIFTLMVKLLKMEFFNQPQREGITFDLMNTDALGIK